MWEVGQISCAHPTGGSLVACFKNDKRGRKWSLAGLGRRGDGAACTWLLVSATPPLGLDPRHSLSVAHAFPFVSFVLWHKELNRFVNECFNSWVLKSKVNLS